MKTISAKEALDVLTRQSSLTGYVVEVTKEVDAVDALRLRKNGVEVPDHLITYHDEDLVYDEDFDEVEWKQIPNKTDEEKVELMYDLALTKEEQQWLETKQVDVTSLLSQLLKNHIKTDLLIQKAS